MPARLTPTCKATLFFAALAAWSSVERAVAHGVSSVAAEKALTPGSISEEAKVAPRAASAKLRTEPKAAVITADGVARELVADAHKAAAADHLGSRPPGDGMQHFEIGALGALAESYSPAEAAALLQAAETGELDSSQAEAARRLYPGISAQDILFKAYDVLLGMTGVVPEDYPYACVCNAAGMCEKDATNTSCSKRAGAGSGAEVNAKLREDEGE
eukprot:TRINITY_DN20880_c0_g1_i1.p1 TRINITY_DN20880_c0_g1~~TRINITY_DN20880_c0_g1_i1.p1  ORF type:complete len:216 (-),score=68.01 TRINITY_DN20880_c0_g1_i1:164-811(-)